MSLVLPGSTGTVYSNLDYANLEEAIKNHSVLLK